MIGLSALYVAFGDTSLVNGLFFGLAPAVVAVISQALIRLSRRSLNQPSLILLAVAAFGALTIFAVPFPAVVLGAGLLGWGIRANSADTDDALGANVGR
jgi:chromate transporter